MALACASSLVCAASTALRTAPSPELNVPTTAENAAVPPGLSPRYRLATFLGSIRYCKVSTFTLPRCWEAAVVGLVHCETGSRCGSRPQGAQRGPF